MLTVTITTTTLEASVRLMDALTEILNPAERKAFQKKLKAEINRVNKERSKRKRR